MILLKRLAILMLIGAMLTVVPSQSVEASSEQELIARASKDLVPEIRTAASLALSRSLTEDCWKLGEKALTILRAGPTKLEELLEELERVKVLEEELLERLEGIATGPTPELRKAAIAPLANCSYSFFLLLGELVGRLIPGELPLEGLTVEELIASIPDAETLELRLARAIAAVRDFTIGCSVEETPSVEERLTLEMRMLQGETAEICGYQLDGSIPAIRKALLSGTKASYYFYPTTISFPLLPFPSLVASSHHARNLLGCQALLDGSIGGETPEFRTAMASAYASFCLEDPAIENLKELTITGESKELRKAAAAELIELLVDSDVDNSQLRELAFTGESRELRSSAGMALGLRWAAEAEEGELRISDIPRKSPATPYSVEQALIIFAVENTAAHPGLARAAMYPLASFFN